MRRQEGPSGKTERSRLSIEAVDRIEDLSPVVELQCEIWGYGRPGADHPLPARVLLAIARSGGLVALARLDGRPVGLSVAWIGRDHEAGRWFLQSQMMGVVESARHRAVGFEMKLHQRRFAFDAGLELIRWTFDPLQSANARLNLHKLGATVSRYHPDYFGTMRSVFNEGIASDRVWADWEVGSERVRRALKTGLPVAEAVIEVNQSVFDTDLGCRVPESLDLAAEAARLALAIPDDFDRMRREQPEVAQRWRAHVREALLHYLGAGYRAVDVDVRRDENGRSVRYVLERVP